jgi:hypothetical protein
VLRGPLRCPQPPRAGSETEHLQVCLLAICEMEQGYCLNLKPLSVIWPDPENSYYVIWPKSECLQCDVTPSPMLLTSTNWESSCLGRNLILFIITPINNNYRWSDSNCGRNQIVREFFSDKSRSQQTKEICIRSLSVRD